MIINVVTIFPEFFAEVLRSSIVGRAAAAGINSLPEADLDRFINVLNEAYS